MVLNRILVVKIIMLSLINYSSTIAAVTENHAVYLVPWFLNKCNALEP